MKGALLLADSNPASPMNSSLHLSMASIYERLMHYTDAEKEYKLALAASDRSQRSGYSQKSQILSQLCNLYLRLNDKAKVQALIPEMIDAAKEMRFQEHYIFDQCITQFLAHDLSAEAERIVDVEIESIAQHLDQTTPNSSDSFKAAIATWTQTFSNAGKDEASARIYEQWIQVVEQEYGATNYETAIAYLAAAKFMIEHDHLARAHELIQKALPLGAKLHDETFVKAMAECAVAFQNKHQSEDAERLFVNALEMADIDTRLNIQLSLGSLYSHEGDGAKATALATAVAGEVKDRFATSDSDVNAAINDLVQTKLKRSDFKDTQLFIDGLSNKRRYYLPRNGLDLEKSQAFQTLDVIMQTYERRQDFAAAANICKMQIDKFAADLDAGTQRNLYRRYSGLLRASGDQDAAAFYDTRANNVTPPPPHSPN